MAHIKKGITGGIVKSIGNIVGRNHNGISVIQSKPKNKKPNVNLRESDNGRKLLKLAEYFDKAKPGIEILMSSELPGASYSWNDFVKSYLQKSNEILPNLVVPLISNSDQFKSNLQILCPSSPLINEVEITFDKMFSIKSMFPNAELRYRVYNQAIGLQLPFTTPISSNKATIGYNSSGLSAGQYMVSIYFIRDTVNGLRSQIGFSIFVQP